MKKKFILTTAVFMLFSSAVFADSTPKVSLNGFYEAHNKVRVKTENIENIKEIVWYIDDSETAKGEEYVISDYDSGCDLKAVVIDEDGNEYESNIRKIENTLKKKEDSFDFSNDIDKKLYSFCAGGTEFLLLNATEDDNSKFLTVTEQPIEARAFNKKTEFAAGNNPQHFYDMLAFLNNMPAGYGFMMDDVLEEKAVAEDYTASGYKRNELYTSLPACVLDHIDWEHVWKCEAVKIGPVYEYCVKGGIVLPSAADVRKYPFAFYDLSNVWLRSARGSNSGNENQVLYLDGGKVLYDEYTAEKRLMPEFYLDRKFFLENKITLAGAEVIKMLSENYGYDELLTLYSEQELKNLGYKKYMFKSAAADNAGNVNIKLQSSETEAAELYVLVLSYDSNNMLTGASCEKIQPIYGENDITAVQNGEYSKITIMLTDRTLVPAAQSIDIIK